MIPSWQNEQWKIAADDTVKKLMKKLKMPGGTKKDPYGIYSWTKNGGHAGEKIIKKVIDAAKAAGFKEKSRGSSDHPAGDWTSFDVVFADDAGNTIGYNKYYGSVAADNRFSLGFKPAAE